MEKPVQKKIDEAALNDGDKRNPFQTWQLFIIGICVTLAMAWLINSPMTKISKGALNIFNFEFMGYSGNTVAILTGLVLFLFLLVYRLMQYSKITRDKLMAVTFFAFITIFFWAIFEQSPNSLTVFAEKYTDRVLTGNASLIFLIINSLMTLVPLLIINWVMFKLFKETFKKYAVANIILSFSFVIIWIIALWMLAKDYYTAGYLTLSDGVLDALKIDKVTTPLTEVPATWFSTLNSLFIISLAPLFSKVWESKYNPNANFKYALGMIFLSLGMVAVAFGSNGIAPGATTASVSMIWLILVYLFHTMGELCISPVGLSYVSKLVPSRMIAFMFGVWYLAVAIGMKGAGIFGENVQAIAEEKGISYFFWMLAGVSFALAIFAVVFRPIVKKLMHDVK